MVRDAFSSRTRGFTLIELMVVLACIGLLLSIAAPRYVQHVEQAREVALRHDLREMRVAIDQFKADQSHYPQDLEELVRHGYLHSVPEDPVTGRDDTWTLVAAPGQGASGIADLHSGAQGRGQDGSSYATW